MPSSCRSAKAEMRTGCPVAYISHRMTAGPCPSRELYLPWFEKVPGPPAPSLQGRTRQHQPLGFSAPIVVNGGSFLPLSSSRGLRQALLSASTDLVTCAEVSCMEKLVATWMSTSRRLSGFHSSLTTVYVPKSTIMSPGLSV